MLITQYLSHLYNRIQLFSLRKRHRSTNIKSGQLLGLKTLVPSPQEKPPLRILQHCYKTLLTEEPSPYNSSQAMWSLSSSMWSPSSPRFQSTIIGDVIGTESGDYMMSDAVEQMEWEPRPKVRSKERGGRRKKREFPPLITLLRRTGQMPWIFQREYGEEGRLVVAVQKVRCSEYKEARREGGRICMRFVRAQYDDDDDDERAYCEECGYSMDYDEDFEFNEETESVDNAKEEKEEENDFALGKEGSDNCDENEGLGEGVTYGGGAGLLHDSESFCGVGGASASVFLGRACSSPLRPMTPVM